MTARPKTAYEPPANGAHVPTGPLVLDIVAENGIPFRFHLLVPGLSGYAINGEQRAPVVEVFDTAHGEHTPIKPGTHLGGGFDARYWLSDLSRGFTFAFGVREYHLDATSCEIVATWIYLHLRRLGYPVER